MDPQHSTLVTESMTFLLDVEIIIQPSLFLPEFSFLWNIRNETQMLSGVAIIGIRVTGYIRSDTCPHADERRPSNLVPLARSSDFPSSLPQDIERNADAVKVHG